MTTCTYACSVPNSSADVQRENLAAFCAQAGLTPDAAFVDNGPDAWCVPLRDRAGGRDLLAHLSPGTTLIIVTPVALAPTLSSYGAMIAALTEIGVSIRLASLGGVGGSSVGTISKALGLIGKALTGSVQPGQSLRALSKSEQIRAGLAYARSAGRRTSRHPPIGYTWVRYQGHWYSRVSSYELRVIEKIVQWRQQQEQHNRCSWAEIARHLLRHKLKTASGLEWSVFRIRRACALAVAGKLPAPPTVE